VSADAIIRGDAAQQARRRLHARRKLVNVVALTLALAAMSFGIFWLIWILIETVRLGIGGMVGNHGVNYLGRFSETTRDLTANDSMGTLDFLVDGLAQVMQ